MTSPNVFEIYAIRYGHKPQRRSTDNFLNGDSHDVPMPLDYYVWLIRNDRYAFVVDTGFGQRAADEREAIILTPPAEGLKLAGIKTDEVDNVIITHLHYDHAGGMDAFPGATFHVQDSEMNFATGRCMCHAPLRHAFDVEDICRMVRNVFDGRVAFHDGDSQLVPGITLHKIGGHTAGMMAVRVWTERGWVVLASDSTHFYANIRERRPFSIVHNLADMMDGYRILESLADTPDHIVPGHDPLVMEIYPSAGGALDKIAVRLDQPPSRSV